MWTRSMLKHNAKQALSGRYWRCFFLSLLLSILGIGAVSNSTAVVYRVSQQTYQALTEPQIWTGNNAAQMTLYDQISTFPPPLLLFILLVLCLAGILYFIWTTFVDGPLAVGLARYYMESRQAPTPLGTAATVFRSPYLNVVKVQFLVRLKVALGCILVIPGLYWSYCYRQVAYLLAENPYLTTRRPMELSRAMMQGEKWRSFILDISFVGWILLSYVTLGLGLLFLEPYVQATRAEFYAALRSKAFSLGLTDARELGGFVRH